MMTKRRVRRTNVMYRRADWRRLADCRVARAELAYCESSLPRNRSVCCRITTTYRKTNRATRTTTRRYRALRRTLGEVRDA
ncbi:MAG TPA: hypothetical protein VHQ22_13155, partial [Terriglobales bacterium]|nr:hypothetical protein [Terriglobales bacterium]